MRLTNLTFTQFRVHVSDWLVILYSNYWPRETDLNHKFVLVQKDDTGRVSLGLLVHRKYYKKRRGRPKKKSSVRVHITYYTVLMRKGTHWYHTLHGGEVIQFIWSRIGFGFTYCTLEKHLASRTAQHSTLIIRNYPVQNADEKTWWWDGSVT